MRAGARALVRADIDEVQIEREPELGRGRPRLEGIFERLLVVGGGRERGRAGGRAPVAEQEERRSETIPTISTIDLSHPSHLPELATRTVTHRPSSPCLRPHCRLRPVFSIDPSHPRIESRRDPTPLCLSPAL